MRRLQRAAAADCSVVIALRDADVTTTRRLMRDGAADVLPAPVSEPALALSLERLLTPRDDGRPGAQAEAARSWPS